MRRSPCPAPPGRPTRSAIPGNNRTHMVRIPDEGRFELRLMDGAANPYLLQAGVLAAGLDGVANGRDPGKRLDINMYTEGDRLRRIRRLPLNLLDALRLFDKSRVARGRAGRGAGVELRQAQARRVAKLFDRALPMGARPHLGYLTRACDAVWPDQARPPGQAAAQAGAAARNAPLKSRLRRGDHRRRRGMGWRPPITWRAITASPTSRCWSAAICAAATPRATPRSSGRTT